MFGVNDGGAVVAGPDGDGMANLQEYWAGTSLTNAANALRFNVVLRPNPIANTNRFSASDPITTLKGRGSHFTGQSARAIFCVTGDK